MSKKLLSILVASAASFAITSCSDEMPVENITLSETTSVEDDGITYPLSKEFQTMGRSESSFEYNWENYDQLELPNGKTTTFPWSTNNITGTVDKNIKKADGWLMIAHNMDLLKNNDEGSFYLLFYNSYTAELKMFYNLPLGVVLPQSTTLPQISLIGNNKLLNATGEVSIPNNYALENYIYLTTLKGNSTVHPGWNIASVDTSYDPNVSSDVQITFDFSRAIIQTQYDLLMSGTTKTDGKITSVGVKNNIFQDAISTVSGSAAGYYLKELGGDTIASIFSEGVSGLFKSAVNLILPSLFGRASQPSIQTVKLTSKTEANIRGIDMSDTASGAEEITVQIGKDKTGFDMGIWNLESDPVIYISPIGILTSIYPGIETGDGTSYYFRPSGKYKASTTINPYIKSKATKYWTEYDIVMIKSEKDSLLPDAPIQLNLGTLDNRKSENSWSTPSSNFKKIGSLPQRDYYKGYPADTWTTYDLWNKYGKQDGYNPYYKYMFAPNNLEYIRGDKKIDAKNTYFKATTYIVINDGGKIDTLINSRLYKPQLEWDPDIYNKYRYKSMSEIQTDVPRDQQLLNLLDEVNNKTWENYRKH